MQGECVMMMMILLGCLSPGVRYSAASWGVGVTPFTPGL